MNRVADDVWITITELRRHFYRIVRDVERGSTFTITRRGQAVARLMPFTASGPAEFKSGVPNLATATNDYLEGFGEA